MKCPRCEKEYQSMNDLDKHCKKVHGKSLIELKYEDDGMTVGDKFNLLFTKEKE